MNRKVTILTLAMLSFTASAFAGTSEQIQPEFLSPISCDNIPHPRLITLEQINRGFLELKVQTTASLSGVGSVVSGVRATLRAERQVGDELLSNEATGLARISLETGIKENELKNTVIRLPLTDLKLSEPTVVDISCRQASESQISGTVELSVDTTTRIKIPARNQAEHALPAELEPLVNE